jgi:hypothetical protein
MRAGMRVAQLPGQMASCASRPSTCQDTRSPTLVDPSRPRVGYSSRFGSAPRQTSRGSRWPPTCKGYRAAPPTTPAHGNARSSPALPNGRPSQPHHPLGKHGAYLLRRTATGWAALDARIALALGADDVAVVALVERQHDAQTDWAGDLREGWGGGGGWSFAKASYR